MKRVKINDEVTTCDKRHGVVIAVQELAREGCWASVRCDNGRVRNYRPRDLEDVNASMEPYRWSRIGPC